MFFDIYYKSASGQVISLVRKPYYLQTIELFDYEWEPYTESGYITEFTKEIVKKSATLTITADTEIQYFNAVNKFYETVEKDVLDMKPGRLYIGRQYMKCYVMASKKTEWEHGIEQMDIDVTFVTDNPNWVEETEYNFDIIQVISTNNKLYPYKYPYRYANGMNVKEINVDHFYSVNFLLRVYGPTVNPMVSIGGHPYLVNIILEFGEYLEVDSQNGTVIKKKANGESVNAFHNRANEDGVFQKISPGLQEVNWSGAFKFDLILYSERGEPAWKQYSDLN